MTRLILASLYAALRRPILLVRKFIQLWTMVTFCLSAAVIAQTAPDAGTIQREIEDTRPQARPVEDFAGQEEGPPEVDAGDTLVTVAAFEFSGNTLIDSATLSDALVSYLERPLSLNDLDRATALVGDLYQDSGFLARVYLPRQEIVDGRVKIDIEEARFGTVRLDRGVILPAGIF